MLHYTLHAEPNSHQWHITLEFDHTDAAAPEWVLANWVPGSYMIRDFSRHIVRIAATCDGRPAALRQTAKNRWLGEARCGRWRLDYTVYANDLSVRASLLNNERAFFDGACLFITLENGRSRPCSVRIVGLPSHWQTATTLRAVGEHTFQADNYAELIDHPFEAGQLEILEFNARGIPHRIALSGHYPDFDRQRLMSDLAAVCTQQLALFPEPAPFSSYLFLLYLGDRIYGGLEHRSSTALHADRHSLPQPGMGKADTAYTELLGLMSHEYFHAWNIKSVKPAVFEPYRLDTESHTEQLWAFEGITSYYDDLMLVRSGVIPPETYLDLLAKTLTRVQQGAGRLKQTLAESGFAAWHKYYKQDENSPNAIVSYYQKGALAALCLDLTIRSRSHGRHSLDTVMQQLYRDYLAGSRGIEEGQWQQHCQTITGLDLQDFFQTALYSTDELPLAACLADAGVALQWHALPRSHGGALTDRFPPDHPYADFGARYRQDAHGITLSHVFNGGSAEQAALSPQDTVIAVNGYACTDFAAHWQKVRPGDTLQLHYFRQGVLQHTRLTAQPAAADTALLRIEDRDKLQHWLGTGSNTHG